MQTFSVNLVISNMSAKLEPPFEYAASNEKRQKTGAKPIIPPDFP